MTEGGRNSLFVFPRWANYALPVLALAGFGGMTYIPTLITLGASPRTTAVGYSPAQPIPYSHKLHVGQLGLDCRYCHFSVEKAAFAAIPPTQVCMNCHTKVRPNSDRLAPLRESWDTGKPVEWIKMHDLPDYALLQSQRTCESRRGLRKLPRTDRHDGQGVSGTAIEHGLVPRLPSQSGKEPASTGPNHESGVEARPGRGSQGTRARTEKVVRHS